MKKIPYRMVCAFASIFYATADPQYAIRSTGDIDYRFANNLHAGDSPFILKPKSGFASLGEWVGRRGIEPRTL